MEGKSPTQASTLAGAVFLSYASQDVEAAKRICEALRATGIEVWFDQTELRGGDAWDRSIRQQIHDCALFVPIISQHTHERLEGYFRLEWKLAVDRTHTMAEIKAFLVPVAIDSTTERDPAVPEKFRELQWTRLPSGDTPPAFVDRIKRLLTSEGPPAAADAATIGPIPVPSVGGSLLFKNLGLGAGAIAAIALAYFVAGKFWPSKHAAPSSTQTVTVAADHASPDIPERSIAVLPFVDMSEKHDQEYFGDGMAEEILNLLAKIPGLTVVGRTSSFQFKGKNEDLRAIGTQLNAAHVLEGSVRNAGDQVRITAQLVNTRSGTHEWSGIYDRHIGDVLRLQDAIAAAVVRELQLTVAPAFQQSRSTLKSADAYDLMLRGRHAADRWDKEGLEEAVALFKQASDRDPTSADAAAELAYAYESQGEEGYVAPAAAFEQARRAAVTAISLDAKCARAHYAMGLVHTLYDWNWAAAEREFQQVATLAPGSADALIGEVNLSLAFGRWDDGLRQVKSALAQDPLNLAGYYALTEIQARRGYLPEAEAAIRRALDIRPTYDWAHWLLGLVLLARGDHDGALIEMQRVTGEDGRQSGLAMVYYALKRKADSDASLARLLNEHDAPSAYLIANVYSFRGEPERAVQWLERGYGQKDPNLTYVKVELPLKGLQGDPRFRAFLRKMNLPE
jgi:TolB-like protein